MTTPPRDAHRNGDELVASLRAAERRAFEAEAKYEALMTQVPAAIYVYSPELDGPTLHMSPFVEEILGVPASAFYGDDDAWDRLIHPDDRERARADYESYLRSGQPEAGDYRYVRPDGRVVWVHDRSMLLRDPDGQPLFIQGVLHDITPTKEAELRMHHLAHHDMLTGLPNRAMFEEHLELAVARARRQGSAVAVLFTDVDGFKSVNDELGHAAGDEMLNEIAVRMRRATRDTDLVARFGGDEFLVLLADLERAPGAAEAVVRTVADRIATQVGRPFRLCDRTIVSSISVGACLFPHEAPDGDNLMRLADAAMYDQKRLERSTRLVS
ncbi:MAG TPA: sensor domain-containing diguanylate cyclase [Actinomycetota bacterium]|jgi:diguanylate cyclase (GGDEF)-like protein/PAS domain S-box-containing protein|nr:sensor domain-containing diguanylate cyclase [Actinomycetota bacterium]